MSENISELLVELENLSKPLRDWLKEHYNLHCQIIINESFVKVTRDDISIPCELED